MKELLEIPPEGDIKSVKGYTDLYRLRVGTFRILFEINHDEKVIYIQVIGNRDLTKKKPISLSYRKSTFGLFIDLEVDYFKISSNVFSTLSASFDIANRI